MYYINKVHQEVPPFGEKISPLKDILNPLSNSHPTHTSKYPWFFSSHTWWTEFTIKNFSVQGVSKMIMCEKGALYVSNIKIS